MTDTPMPRNGTPVVVAIDIGGSWIKGALVGADARPMAGERVATPDASEAELVEAVAALVLGLAEKAQRRGTPAVAVGVSTAGIIDESSGTARRGANLRWRNTELGRHLEERTGLTATLLQDARAAAQAEAVLGAGRDADNFLMVVLGTGVGGAVVSDGRPLLGSHGLAGEIGHLQLDADGPLCGCGGRGCLEMVASGAALSRRYAAATGRRLPAEAVLDLVVDGDPVATALWSGAVSALAAALAAAVAVLDIELVIFGGGMAAAGQLLLDPLAQELAARVSLAPPPRLTVAALGNDAGLIGAAAAALRSAGHDRLIRSWQSQPPSVAEAASSSA
ncbi:MAG: ROK family protein [Candidatus Dormiibacterota bacterium]